MLNAKPEHAEREGETIAEAGQPGAVTIATNMAGRGVDIKLGGNAEHLTALELAKLGLQPGDPDYEEHYARGAAGDRGAGRGETASWSWRPAACSSSAPSATSRAGSTTSCAAAAGRQGDPGESRFFLSAEDDLVRLFAGDRIYTHPRPLRHDRRGGRRGADRGQDAHQADREGAEEGRGAELPHPQARARVRRRHERAAADRLRVPRRGARGPRHGRAARARRSPRSSSGSSTSTRPATTSRSGTSTGLFDAGSSRYSRSASALEDVDREAIDREELIAAARTRTRSSSTTSARSELGDELMRALERYLLLQIIDQRWREHLYDMDYLREGIHLRGFAQIDPLVAYKNEGFDAVPGPDEHDLGGLRAHDLQRRGRGRGRDGASGRPSPIAPTPVARPPAGGRVSPTPAASVDGAERRMALGGGAARARPASPSGRRRASWP